MAQHREAVCIMHHEVVCIMHHEVACTINHEVIRMIPQRIHARQAPPAFSVPTPSTSLTVCLQKEVASCV
jgi:hypothetical protein